MIIVTKFLEIENKFAVLAGFLYERLDINGRNPKSSKKRKMPSKRSWWVDEAKICLEY